MDARSRKPLVVAATVFAVLIVAGALTAVLAGGGHSTRRALTVSPIRPAVPSPTARVGSPVAPATTVPAVSPVQQQYDQAFARGYSSAASKAMIAHAARLQLPAPAVGGGWPALGVSNTPDGWARSFTRALLTIDFSRQGRPALGGWLVTQEAPDLMPGIPAGFRYRALFTSVMDPAVMTQASIVPSPSQWRADAKTKLRWTIGDLQVQPDPQWQSMVAAGWQPRDVRASLEDVTGLLESVHGKTATTRHVSLTVAVGSARWHHGYGTVAVTAEGS